MFCALGCNFHATVTILAEHVRRMRIMIVTDAWLPQTNGVVNTLAQTAAWLAQIRT